MVGSGNVGLIVSYQLLQAGAQVEAVVEAGPAIGGYGVHANKLKRAGVPFYLSHTVQRAFGTDGVEAVELVELDDHFKPIPGTEKRLEADTVCMAVGLTPMTELASLGGCGMTISPSLGGVVPMHDWRYADHQFQCLYRGRYLRSGGGQHSDGGGPACRRGSGGEPGPHSIGGGRQTQGGNTEQTEALRSGQFGAKRAEAKEKIEEAYAQWKKGVENP